MMAETEFVADFELEPQVEIEADFEMQVVNTDHSILLNRDLPDQHPMSAITGLDSALDGKQDVLTAGEGISIENGVISATVQSAVWGNITGTLSDQTDLQNALNGKLDNSALNGYATQLWVTSQGYQTSSDVASAVATETTARELADSGLQDQINILKARGRFLALWNCATGLAESNPPSSPYVYQAGDYFIIGVVSSATPPVNYKPDGSSYTTGVASTTVESNAVDVDDVYYYDGSVWRLQVNTQKTTAFVNIAGNPYDNTNLANALNAKADASAIPTVNNGTLTIQVNSTDLQTFTANQSSNATANIPVPTDTSDLTNGAGYITSSSLTNYVTTNTSQEITGEKTFKGQKRIIFKQSTANDKLGFTLKDNSNNERGYLEYNPGNTVDGANVFTLGSYSTNASYRSIVGFRYYDGANSAAYNLLAPLAGNAKSAFSLTTTYTNFYQILGISNGTTTVTTANTGVIDISSITIQNTATANNSVTLFGTANTTSYYVNSMNIGFQSVANGGNGTAVGYNSQTSYYGAALGSGAMAGGQASVAIGYGANASGISSIQIGYGTNAEKNTLYIGFYNSGSNMNYKLLGSDGKIPVDRISTATGTDSITLFGTANTSNYGVNIGVGSSCAGEAGTALGKSATVSGIGGTAIGKDSVAGLSAAALGYEATASGSGSIAIGRGATASGSYSIQIGYGTNADANSMYVGLDGLNNYKLLDSAGKIPAGRLTIATSVSSASTNDEVVGAKLFYDTCGDIETLINAL